MKKFWKSVAGVAVVAGALVWYAVGDGDSGEGKNDAPVDNTEIVQTVSSSLEIPAATGGRVVKHDAYVTSYNTQTLIPDWVAYELTADEADDRRDREGIEFKMDPDLRGCTQAMREDYSNSGWTKGHMMPAADAASSSSTMAQTFYFTNICPQNEVLNAGDWQFLEKKVRSWAKRYGSIWVVTGPIVGENRYGTIGDRDVTVPDSFYKALMIRRSDGSYSAAAFVMDNDEERYFLKDCVMTVNELEELTGIDFFPGLDDKVEEKVEGTLRKSDWGIK